MCKQQNFAPNCLILFIKSEVKYCNKYIVIIEFWLLCTVWWTKKKKKLIFYKEFEPIAYFKTWHYIYYNLYLFYTKKPKIY